MQRISLAVGLFASAAVLAEVEKVEVAEVRSIESSYRGEGWSRVRVRVAESIPFNYYASCDYYNHDSKIMASTRLPTNKLQDSSVSRPRHV